MARHCIFSLYFVFIIISVNSCKDPNLKTTVKGIWKIDSIQVYNKGAKRMDIQSDYYIEFNEFNDLVYHMGDSIHNVNQFEIRKEAIKLHPERRPDIEQNTNDSFIINLSSG